MPLKKLKEFLDTHDVKYVTISHSPAYTAQEIAASAHIPGKELAKTVVVKLDERPVLVVLPASYQVDLDLLRLATGARTVELATEYEMLEEFPDCDVGAMPPFGNLFGVEVYVADSLAEDEKIAFNAGSFTELVQLPYRDFARLVEPTVLKIASKV
jgi:Ala-tRNA(Pro) deacylase